jgi:hypothetical protein
MGRPRTREHFPRMKDRAAGRRIRRTRKTVFVDIFPSITKFVNAMAKAFDEMARTVARVLNDVGNAARRWAEIFSWLEAQKRRNRWVSTHQLPAHPSPWAAPITKETP